MVLFGPMSPARWGPPPGRPYHRALWHGTTSERGDLPGPVHPALLAVGYILGYRQSAIMVSGSLISALVLTPLIAIVGAMTTYLVERYLPGRDRAWLEEALGRPVTSLFRDFEVTPLADLLRAEGIALTLGHSKYIKAISYAGRSPCAAAQPATGEDRRR